MTVVGGWVRSRPASLIYNENLVRLIVAIPVVRCRKVTMDGAGYLSKMWHYVVTSDRKKLGTSKLCNVLCHAFYVTKLV